MKKILFSMMALMSTVATMAQVITFAKTEHDFGKIQEADGRVTTIFEFKNEGMEPLVLSNVRASCGCTTPKWTKEPIEPGQSGEITVTYNPNGRPGRFQKTITVTSNAKENSTAKLYIKGEVIPKPATPVNTYNVKMGELSLKSRNLSLGTVKKEEIVVKEIEYANQTDHDITVDLLLSDKDYYLDGQATLLTIKPKESGVFKFSFNAAQCKLYGPVNMTAYVVVNGKKLIQDEYKLEITANVVEDFSAMTVEQRQAAPIAELSANTIDLGKIPAGKSVKKSIILSNAGQNQLLVRRVHTPAEMITLEAPKAIKSGKKGEIKVTVNTVVAGKQLDKKEYKQNIIVITNDPQQPTKMITVTWTIE